MKVGEVGFVIRKPDGSYVLKGRRRADDRPFRTWDEANRLKEFGLARRYGAMPTPIEGEIVMVKLVPVGTVTVTVTAEPDASK